MNKEVFEQLTRARTGLILDQPFFGQLALRLTLVEDPSTRTMAVDGKRMFYNPTFVSSLSAGLTKAIVAHEVMHCVFDHMSRLGERNHRRWNQAGDYIINGLLEKAGFNFEGTGLLDSTYDGMSADEVYNLLPESQKGDGKDPLDELIAGNPDSCDVDAVDWKIATVQAASAAKAVGKLPGSMERFLDELMAPKVDWREMLRNFITEINKNDYTWSRPSRRFIHQGYFLPTLHSENMGEIVVAIDTSGSIDQATLNAFGSEIKAIVQSTRPSKTTVIYCDAAVNHVDTFDPNDEMHFAMHGGGGTDFCPPFAHIVEHGLRPVCFVYLTDGYGPFPEDPGFPTLWCCTTDVVSPIGQTVPIRV